MSINMTKWYEKQIMTIVWEIYKYIKKWVIGLDNMVDTMYKNLNKNFKKYILISIQIKTLIYF